MTKTKPIKPMTPRARELAEAKLTATFNANVDRLWRETKVATGDNQDVIAMRAFPWSTESAFAAKTLRNHMTNSYPHQAKTLVGLAHALGVEPYELFMEPTE